MIKYLNLEQENKLANDLYYGGGYTKKYSGGGQTTQELKDEEEAARIREQGTGLFKGNYKELEKAGLEGKRSDMSTLRKGTSFGSEGTAGIVGSVAGVASELVGEFDKTPDKYDNANIAQESLKYAAMGAMAGPIGAGVGALVGAGVGMLKKNKGEKEAVKAENKKQQNEGYESFMKDQEEFAGYKEGGVINKYAKGGNIKNLAKGYRKTDEYSENLNKSINVAKSGDGNVFQKFKAVRGAKRDAKNNAKMVANDIVSDMKSPNNKATASNDYRALMTKAGKRNYGNEFGVYGDESDTVLAEKEGISVRDAQAMQLDMKPEVSASKSFKEGGTVDPKKETSQKPSSVKQFILDYAPEGEYDPYSELLTINDSHSRIAGEEVNTSGNSGNTGEGNNQGVTIDGIQDTLTVAGLYPGIGVAADFVNMGISTARAGTDYLSGDTQGVKDNLANLAFHTAAAVPLYGQLAVGSKFGNKIVQKYGHTAQEAAKIAAKEVYYGYKYSKKIMAGNNVAESDYETGGMTKGAYSHSTNPLKVVDKSGQDTGMELTGGEGVFDKPFMGKLKGLLSGGKYQAAGEAVQNEMKTWKHK